MHEAVDSERGEGEDEEEDDDDDGDDVVLFYHLWRVERGVREVGLGAFWRRVKLSVWRGRKATLYFV